MGEGMASVLVTWGPWWVACACLGAFVGSFKGRVADGVVLGLGLGPLGVLIALVISDERRKCPACRGPVERVATVCRHCQGDLPPMVVEPERPRSWAPIIGVTLLAIGVIAVLAVMDQSSRPTYKPGIVTITRDGTSTAPPKAAEALPPAHDWITIHSVRLRRPYGLTEVRLRIENVTASTLQEASFEVRCYSATGDSLGKTGIRYDSRLKPGRKRRGSWDLLGVDHYCDDAREVRVRPISVVQDGRYIRLKPGPFSRATR